MDFALFFSVFLVLTAMELRTHSVTMFCWCVGTYSVFENADLWFTNTVESPGKSFPKSLHEESVHVATGVEFARTTNFFSWLVDSIEARDLEISPPQAEIFWVFSHVSSGLSKHSAHRRRASEQRKITKKIQIDTFPLKYFVFCLSTKDRRPPSPPRGGIG